MTTKKEPPITLDPNNEFERVLIEMVQMHRDRAAGYGSDDDEHWNFYNAAHRLGCSPIEALDAFVAKHEAAWLRWKLNSPQGERTSSKYSDDASLDMAVYAVIRRVLYLRGDY